MLALAILAWDTWVQAKDIPKYMVPRPGAVLDRLLNDFGVLRGAFIATLTTALTGYVAAIVVGFNVAIVFASNKVAQRSLCISTNVCVESTTWHGFMLDFYTVLVEDCCGYYKENLHIATIENVNDRCGVVASAADVQACWAPIAVEATV